MAYARRGFKGGTRQTTLVGDINNSATTVPGADLSTWAGLTSNGDGTATINIGKADEEVITFTGISGNDLTGVTRGAAGTTNQSHTSGATIDHTTSVTDADEANAHIADTTLDHHTQYAKTNGSRTLTGTQTITRATAGIGVSVTKEAASVGAGSVVIGRSATAQPQSLVFGVGVAYSAVIGRLASSDNLEVGFYNGTIYTRKASWLPSGSVELNAGTSIATGATGGFVGLPYMGGTPSGVPDVSASIVYDTAANKLWVYSGSWRSVALA